MIRDRIKGIDRSVNSSRCRRTALITIKDINKKSTEDLLEELVDQVEALNKNLDESNQKMIHRLDKILKEMKQEAL